MNTTSPLGYTLRRRFCAVMLFCVCLGALSLHGAKPWRGLGTPADPYVITTPSQLDTLRYLSDGGAGLCFVLGADIDADTLQGPIPRFGGKLYGNGHRLRYVMVSEADSVALFGRLMPGSEVRSLILCGEVSGVSCVSALACEVSGRVTGVENRMAVTASVRRGAGLAVSCTPQGSMDSCVNAGKVSAPMYVAGMVADCSGFVGNCRNTGSLSGSAYVGGITAQMLGAGRVERCVNDADLVAENADYVAGIAACTSVRAEGSISGCRNNGRIAAADYAAGIGARMEAGMSVDSCVNYGPVYAVRRYSGGIAGVVNGEKSRPAALVGCRNYGTVSGQGEYIGGIAGFSYESVTMTDCRNLGPVRHTGVSGAYVGGVSGMTFSRHDRCVNVAPVSAPGCYAVGGVAGATENSCKLTGCYNIGAVSATSAPARGERGIAGGLAGDARQTKFADCFNLGSVEAYEAVGGLCGLIHSQVGFTACYNGGAVTAHIAGPVPVGAIGAYAQDVNVNTLTATALYYDAELCGRVSQFDLTSAEGLSTEQMCLTAPSGSYRLAPWCMPLLADAAPEAVLASVCIGFSRPGDRADNVNSDVHIGLREGLEWTLSRCFEFVTPTLIKPVHRGESNIEIRDVATGSSRRFALTVVSYSGTGVSPALEHEEWFTLEGFRVTSLQRGGVYLQRLTASDGTVTVRKVVYRGA